MRRQKKINLIVLIIGLVLVTSTSLYIKYIVNVDGIERQEVRTLEENDIILDNNNLIHVREGYNNIEEIYIYVPAPLSIAGDKPDDFYDLLKQSEDKNEKRRAMDIFIKEEKPKELIDTLINEKANATIEIKGNIRNREIQKSFKIRFYDKTRLWEGLTVSNLEKNYFDSTKVRSKLINDYIKVIPNLNSIRTRFINLLIMDQSRDESYKSYGLYMQAEQPNTIFLRDSGFNTNANYYKIENFDFSRNADAIKLESDETFSKKQFEKVLVSKQDKNHQKLIDMLEAVNDYNQDINDVIEKHFDRENYLTWLVTNIIFDNFENTNRNYYIYCSINSNKWYFIPTDFDGSLGEEEERGRWQKGLSMYWNNVLHRRFIADEENLKDIENKMNELRKIINPENTKVLLDLYYDNIEEQLKKPDELKYLVVTIEKFRSDFLALPTIIERNINLYKSLIQRPMPTNQFEVKNEEEGIVFHWTESYDIQGGEIKYIIQLSSEKDFSIIKYTDEVVDVNKYVKNNMADGICYWRIIVTDNEGNMQTSMNVYEDEFGDEFFGMRRVVIENGKVVNN